MNIRFVIQLFGLLIVVLAAAMAGIAVWGAIDAVQHGGSAWLATRAEWISAGAALVVGGVLYLIGRAKHSDYMGRREALLLVALVWLVGAAVSALPFWVWAHLDTQPQSGHPFRSAVSCYFEAMSGLTTTGASVLADVEAVPIAILLWRATTHWLGGLGIVVLFVAVLPTLGVGGKKLFQAEAGPSREALRPKIVETARVLLLIYIGLNVGEIVLLRLCGLSWIDATCEAFATIATGGFSRKTASIAGYGSLAVEIVVIVFMLLSGINFGLYFELVKGRFSNVWRDPELRWYLGITLVACVIVVVALVNQPIQTAAGAQVGPGPGAAARYGVFAVVSTRTNTGFATADVNPWGFLSHLVLLTFMVSGACMGSTGGGVKLVRCLIAGRVLLAGIGQAFRPNVVKPIRIGRTVVSHELRDEALSYVLLYAIVLLAGGVAIHLIEPAGSIDVLTAFSASAACLSNTGPGLGAVGTVQNYGWMSDASKIVLSLVMLLGRLEVYALAVLFAPQFWRAE